MTYSPPSGNITSSVDFFNYINGTIENWFFSGIVGVLFFVILVRLLYNSDASRAFTASSFICMVLSILLRVADLVNTPFMVIFIILTVIGAVWMQVENAKFG